ncbi:MAG: hypothetical protein H6604_08785 [Flavobacteriales bacterium]|nr:hypothetical protein [Flavobacteriales bacterium]
MANAVQIQNKLIKNILDISSIPVLESINQYINFLSDEQEVISVPPQIKEKISVSQKQISEDDFLTDEQANEIDLKWLDEK